MSRGQTNRQKDVARVLRDKLARVVINPGRKILAGLKSSSYNDNPIVGSSGFKNKV